MYSLPHTKGSMLQLLPLIAQPITLFWSKRLTVDENTSPLQMKKTNDARFEYQTLRSASKQLWDAFPWFWLDQKYAFFTLKAKTCYNCDSDPVLFYGFVVIHDECFTMPSELQSEHSVEKWEDLARGGKVGCRCGRNNCFLRRPKGNISFVSNGTFRAWMDITIQEHFSSSESTMYCVGNNMCLTTWADFVNAYVQSIVDDVPFMTTFKELMACVIHTQQMTYDGDALKRSHEILLTGLQFKVSTISTIVTRKIAQNCSRRFGSWTPLSPLSTTYSRNAARI